MQYGAISDSEYFILKIISIRISGSEAVFWGDLYQSMDWTINSSSWDCIQEPLIVVYQSDTNTKDRSRLVPQLRMPGMHNKKLFWFSLVAIVSEETRSCSSEGKKCLKLHSHATPTMQSSEKCHYWVSSYWTQHKM